MTDNHSADNPQGTPQQPNPPSSWFAGWEEFLQPPESDANPTAEGQPAEVWPGWQTVDFPNAIPMEALERQGTKAQGSSNTSAPHQAQGKPSTNPVDLPDWSVRTIPPAPAANSSANPSVTAPVDVAEVESGQFNISELVSLIQELNQCNSALLDRVSLLEEALDQSQQALQAGQAATQQADLGELVTTQQQLTQLFQELESSHQVNQRQQELIETLTNQVTSSQERLIRLEQDYTALQTQNQEQAHVLAHSETLCRDLQVRLQRQQRYTLQFKAALERCLEVATPPFDGGTVEGVLPVTQPLSPKLQTIQPWSTQAGGSQVPSKLDALVNQPAAEEISPTPPVPSKSQEAIAPVGYDAMAYDAYDVAGEEEDVAEAVQSAAAELKSVLDSLLQDPPGAEKSGTTRENLWQDLSKLVDMPTEETVEAVEQPISKPSDRPSSIPPLRFGVDTPPQKVARMPLSMPMESPQSRPAPAHANAQPPVPIASEGSSPSPIVYPQRPTRKIASLAAVDLPTFPRK
ncbi:hypothetical protein ACQ4M4_08220 [Leptolyngbya sp. AN02str]|uniref:hypothetical protein n=1 Tax=Leptolyngbya sp. AN02str TaxID=3423363 RepID=UPI003D315188